MSQKSLDSQVVVTEIKITCGVSWVMRQKSKKSLQANIQMESWNWINKKNNKNKTIRNNNKTVVTALKHLETLI